MDSLNSSLFCDTALAKRIERAFTARGAPVQVELAHLVDPAIGVLLTDRGYRLTSFENVLGLALKGEPERVTPPGVEVRPSGEDEFEPWLDVMADSFAHPDAQGASSPEEFPREAVTRAMRDLMAGAGVMRYVAHRRRGVQTALLSTRLADATAAGCDIAVITTQPGSKSQQNAQRRGFDLLYTRAILVKLPTRRNPGQRGADGAPEEDPLTDRSTSTPCTVSDISGCASREFR